MRIASGDQEGEIAHEDVAPSPGDIAEGKAGACFHGSFQLVRADELIQKVYGDFKHHRKLLVRSSHHVTWTLSPSTVTLGGRRIRRG